MRLRRHTVQAVAFAAVTRTTPLLRTVDCKQRRRSVIRCDIVYNPHSGVLTVLVVVLPYRMFAQV